MKTINIMFNEEARKFNVIPETNGCVGCVARIDSSLCKVLNKLECSLERTIFVETNLEETFTLDQIKNAWDATWGGEPGESFLRNLNRTCDPEYNEYKRLQSKFEV